MANDYDAPKPQPKEPASTPVQWTPEQWVNDDCKVRECIDGYIHYEYRGYQTVARCPRCTRARNQWGKICTGISVYGGVISLRTDAEMAERREERREIVERKSYRALRYRVVEGQADRIGQ